MDKKILSEVNTLVQETITENAKPILACQLSDIGDREGLAAGMVEHIFDLFNDEGFALKVANIVSEYIESEDLAWSIIDQITVDEIPIY